MTIQSAFLLTIVKRYGLAEIMAWTIFLKVVGAKGFIFKYHIVYVSVLEFINKNLFYYIVNKYCRCLLQFVNNIFCPIGY